MPTIDFDRYYRYAELTDLLHAYAAEYPDLVQVQAIGKSYEGRDIWLVTLTHQPSGPAHEKPALWVDANIHATETSASTAALYFIHQAVTGYGSDEEYTRLLNTRTCYVCPRVNPDGAELALADRPRIIRSSTRPWPYDERALDGLVLEDLDGDGRMLFMRVPDANGAWKISDQEPRLMVPRDPTEIGGQYYRVLPEGRLENYDGVTVTVQPPKERLDLNRNFPAHWRTENEQTGAGAFPTSEPEVHTIVEFISRNPNITAGVTFHTFSGVLLRPYDDKPDDKMPAEDLWTFKAIGEKGTDLTGYPNISVYHDFRYHPNDVITGVFDAWMYEHRGVFSWTVEIWAPQREAGITDYKYIDWFRSHPFDHDLQMLKWSDETLNGEGYIDWYPYDHPQLGRVELGGWNAHHMWRNPPPQFLEKEVARFPRWLAWKALIAPELAVHELSARQVGESSWVVRLVVHNTGWLPTYVTKVAQKQGLRGVVAEITLPAGATLETGKARAELGHLEGRAYKPSMPGMWGGIDPTSDRAKAEWTVKAPAGSIVQVQAYMPRAGTVRAMVTLE